MKNEKFDNNGGLLGHHEQIQRCLIATASRTYRHGDPKPEQDRPIVRGERRTRPQDQEPVEPRRDHAAGVVEGYARQESTRERHARARERNGEGLAVELHESPAQDLATPAIAHAAQVEARSEAAGGCIGEAGLAADGVVELFADSAPSPN